MTGFNSLDQNRLRRRRRRCGEGGVVASEEDIKECTLRLWRKVARTLTQSLKHHPSFKKNGSRNWPKIPVLIDSCFAIRPMPLSPIRRKSEGVNTMGVNDTYFSVRKFELVSGRTKSFRLSEFHGSSCWWRLSFDLVWNGKCSSTVVAVGDNNYRVVGIFMIQMLDLHYMGFFWRKCLDGQYPSSFRIWNRRILLWHIPMSKQIKPIRDEAAKKPSFLVSEFAKESSKSLTWIVSGADQSNARYYDNSHWRLQ